MSNLCFWLEVFHSGEDEVSVASKLGFELKCKRTEDFYAVTFLKGWWTNSADARLVWLPLPSQVLKLGKTLRPTRLFSVSKRDSREGVKTLAWAIHASMREVPSDYPILGPFLAKLGELGHPSNCVVSAAEDAWFKPRASVGQGVLKWRVVSQITERYGLTSSDILRVECLIRSIHCLPVFAWDPVFARLAEVDYC